MLYLNVKPTINFLFFLVPLVLIAGLRPIGIDPDSLNYASILNISFQENGFFDKELFFMLIIYCNQLFFSGNTTSFFLIFAFIGVFLKLYAIKRLCRIPELSYISYILLYFILHEMTQIRVGVASAIFLLAIPDILNRNLKGFLIKTIFACSFHYQAIFMLITYLFNPYKFSRIYYLILPIIAVFLATIKNQVLDFIKLIINFMPGFISDYANIYIFLLYDNKHADINTFNFYYMSVLLFYFFIVFNYKKLKFETDLILIKILGLSLFSYFSLSAVPVWAFRISEFFGIVIVILIVRIIFLFKEKIFISIPIFSWMGVYFLIITVGKVINT